MQTALVVGLDGPVHIDRDHRIKVQFHWQRGAGASHRLDHPAGSSNSSSNAPASDASGTWVRVAESMAGANWGMNFTPRLGQEVLVGFVEGDIDRPVVIGSVYNGQGEANAQANQAAAGAAKATGNAPAWFPGDQAQGRLQGHQHAAVHAGFKTQALASSQSGSGGFNQLVHDDTPQAGSIELGTSMSAGGAATRLQLGHLLQQTDNQRLAARGHGIDLMSDAWGAVRAGSGLLLSAHGKPGSSSTGQQLDSQEPLASLEQAAQLVHALAESAQKQNAKLQDEPNVIGATDKETAKQLDVERAHRASLQSLGGEQSARWHAGRVNDRCRHRRRPRICHRLGPARPRPRCTRRHRELHARSQHLQRRQYAEPGRRAGLAAPHPSEPLDRGEERDRALHLRQGDGLGQAEPGDRHPAARGQRQREPAKSECGHTDHGR